MFKNRKTLIGYLYFKLEFCSYRCYAIQNAICFVVKILFAELNAFKTATRQDDFSVHFNLIKILQIASLLQEFLSEKGFSLTLCLKMKYNFC